MRWIARLLLVTGAMSIAPGLSGGPAGVQAAPDGGMQLTIRATPETVSSIVPSVSLNGVDVFPTNCAPDVFESQFTSEVTYVCTGLELAVYDVSAPVVAGIDQNLTCSPVGSFTGFDFSKADVSVDGFVYCTLSVEPPGFALSLFGVGSAAATNDLLVLDAAGDPVDANCRPDTLPDDELRLQCGPLPFGEYVIPHQDVDGTGAEQPFTCAPNRPSPDATAFEFDNSFTLEPRDGEIDRYRWYCINEEPPTPPVPTIALGVGTDPEIADVINVELRQNGVDVRGDACEPAVPPLYLDARTDGFSFSLCSGDWSGTITPVITNVPPGYVSTSRCFEENPVLNVIGPSAIFGPTSNSKWICRLMARRPGVLLVVDAEGDAGVVDALQLTTADGAAISVPCVVDVRGSTAATLDRTVMSCAPVPSEPLRIGALLASDGSALSVGCGLGRDADSYSDLESYVHIGADPAFPWWTCRDLRSVELIDRPDPNGALPGLPATGSRETWMAMSLGALLVLAGAALLATARRRTAGPLASTFE